MPASPMEGLAGETVNFLNGESALFEDLHARQIFVYGTEGVRRLACANVLVLGSRSVGAEVGRYLSWSGCYILTLDT